MKVFWMLYPEGHAVPGSIHMTEEHARAEAERLAKQHKVPVYLLEATARCEARGIEWEGAGPYTTEAM